MSQLVHYHAAVMFPPNPSRQKQSDLCLALASSQVNLAFSIWVGLLLG